MPQTEQLRISVLGPFDVRLGGARVGPGGAKPRSLLALLALRAGEPVVVAEIVDGLWGDRPPLSAVGAVQTYVSAWRQALSTAGRRRDVVERVGQAYVLRVTPDECDVLQLGVLRRSLAATRSERKRNELQGLEEALALFRGPVLADLVDEPFHAAATRGSKSSGWSWSKPGPPERCRSTETPGRSCRSCGTPGAATRGGRRSSSSRCGRSAGRAGSERRWTSTRLLDGPWPTSSVLTPGPTCRRCTSACWRQDDLLAPAAPLVPSPSSPAGLVGRDREVEELLSLLVERRLVTLTGPAGCGKTRLAVAVAGAVAAATARRCVLVELAAVDDPALVEATLAVALGATGSASVQALAGLLADEELLLVVDNAEHLPGVGRVLAALVEGTRHVRVLVTSRAPLHVPGEQQYPVSPLPLPATSRATSRAAQQPGGAAARRTGWAASTPASS